MGDQIERQLEQFGLSEAEVGVYLAVLDRGISPVAQVADAADLSQRYVYDLVEELAERGFLQLDDHVTPTQVRATPPEELVSALTDELADLRPKLEARRESVDRGRMPFEVLRSRRPVKSALADMIADAEDEVVVGLPGPLVEAVEGALRDAVDRGVVVLLLLSGTTELPVPPEGLATAVRARRYWSPAAVAVDTDRAGLVPPEELFRTANSSFAAVRIQQPNMVYLLRSALLGQEWPLGEELYAEPPVELPARYGWFHAGVIQAASHQQAGTPLRATVRARPARSDVTERNRRAGRVVGVRQCFVEPRTNEHPIESALVLETDDGRVDIGGPGAIYEDLEATSIELERIA